MAPLEGSWQEASSNQEQTVGLESNTIGREHAENGMPRNFHLPGISRT